MFRVPATHHLQGSVGQQAITSLSQLNNSPRIYRNDRFVVMYIKQRSFLNPLRRNGELPVPRQTGRYRITRTGGEEVRAFVPLPATSDRSSIGDGWSDIRSPFRCHDGTDTTCGRRFDGTDLGLVPLRDSSAREAVATSQIEGAQATFRDVVAFEATSHSDHPDDVREICNYVAAPGTCPAPGLRTRMDCRSASACCARHTAF